MKIGLKKRRIKEDSFLKQEIFQSVKKYYQGRQKNKKSFTKGDCIRYGDWVFDEKEIINPIDSLLDFWLTKGKYAERFERKFAKFLGIKYCSLVNSGSSANLLAFSSLTSYKFKDRRIKKGDEIITIAATFPTTITPIIQYGAIPVFIDIELETYNADCSKLEDALSKNTKAIFLPHTLGNPFNIKSVKNFCNRYNLWLIEDNCDALGSRYFYKKEWRYTGTFGDLGTSSFFPSHHITMGEGGAVYTNNQELKEVVESFRDWGRDCRCNQGQDNSCKKRFTQQYSQLPKGYDHKFIYSHFGYNLKLLDFQSAIGCAQLEKLPIFIKKRKKNWQLIMENLKDLSDRFILPGPTANSDPSWFGFILTVREGAGFTRNKIVRYLEDNGIQTRMLFAGNIIRQPCFDKMRNKKQGYRIIGELKNTDIVLNQSFWIGVYPGITDKMIEFIIDRIKKFVKKN